MKICLSVRVFFAITLTLLIAGISPAHGPPPPCPPEPVFEETNFLFTPDIPEFNVDFALQWTDSAASIFIQPFDAVILHLDLEGDLWDVYIFSDVGMNRLTTWVLRVGGGRFGRELLSITEYCGEDADGFKMPSGLTTNAIGRLFDPQYDVIYLADRGNDRIVELGLEPIPDRQECRLFFIRSFGEKFLEWPVDIAISAYHGRSDADFYVVDWGHEKETGELVRLDADGNYEYSNGFACHAVTGRPVVGLHRPVSVACYPDTLDGNNYIFVTETVDASITVLFSNSDNPFVMWHVVSLEAGNFLDIDGVAIDGGGRIFVVNRGAQFIEAFGPRFCDKYPSIGGPGQRNIYLDYPSNLIIDMYHGFCEALLIESYNRQSGLRSFQIGGDCETMQREGGFRRAKAVVSPAKQAAPQLPLIYSLHNAYPNPFNSKCKIGFSIPQESRVSIVVFDALGRKVAKLLDKTLPVGEHSVTFDASDLSSGTYFYKMTAGKFARTRQIVLVK